MKRNLPKQNKIFRHETYQIETTKNEIKMKRNEIKLKPTETKSNQNIFPIKVYHYLLGLLLTDFRRNIGLISLKDGEANSRHFSS